MVENENLAVFQYLVGGVNLKILTEIFLGIVKELQTLLVDVLVEGKVIFCNYLSGLVHGKNFH